MARLIELIKPEIKQRCIDRGFKTKGDFYVKNGESSDFQDALGFGYCTFPNARDVDPFIGFFNKQVRELFQFIKKKKASGLVFCINIGYLNPAQRYQYWTFREGMDFGPVFDDMFKEIEETAYPFWRDNRTIPKLIEIFENDVRYPIANEELFFILPILYLLEGNKEAGIKYLEKELPRYGNLVDDYKNYYLNYCEFDESSIVLKKGRNEP